MFKLIYKWTDKIKDKVAAFSAKLNEKGQGITEYAMILAAVAIIAAVVLFTGGSSGNLEDAVTNAFSNASGKITNVTDHGNNSSNSNNNGGGGGDGGDGGE